MVEKPDNPYVRDPPTSFAPIEETSEREACEQVEQLREAIEYHDYRYYVENDPVISDHAYDALFDRFRALEPAFDLHDENSPTRRIGGEPLDELETVEHTAPMLGLQSAFEESRFDVLIGDELGEPGERHRFVLADTNRQPHVDCGVPGSLLELDTRGEVLTEARCYCTLEDFVTRPRTYVH